MLSYQLKSRFDRDTFSADLVAGLKFAVAIIHQNDPIPDGKYGNVSRDIVGKVLPAAQNWLTASSTADSTWMYSKATACLQRLC
ncbi:MAG: hypothetical protein M9965_11110 [Anaerolineae bacterium]|nr:hypothetical protein [Anaerolineae bacterium]MCO5195891.1 hypothetical protein [Anaerolineae bacterium]